MNLILLGAPGSGKGTQSANLEAQLGLTHISSGDLFRYNLNNDTALGQQVRKYLDAGELVPDDITVAMIEDRMQQPDVERGVMLDGFPRTIPQAEALDAMLARTGGGVSGVLHLDVPDDVLMTRLSGRLICKRCQTPFHKTFRPFKTCPVGECESGEYLYQRSDDQPEAVRTRLDAYYAQTQPLIDFYRARKLLATINGDDDVNTVSAAMLAAAKAFAADE